MNSNTAKIYKAQNALATYRDGDDLQAPVINLFTDLMHYCEANGVSGFKALRLALKHYAFERNGVAVVGRLRTWIAYGTDQNGDYCSEAVAATNSDEAIKQAARDTGTDVEFVRLIEDDIDKLLKIAEQTPEEVQSNFEEYLKDIGEEIED